ncbi:MAG: hypothetical protein WAN43_06775 [Rhodomicrobium sp.]|jgi:hypothetical protein
MSAPPLTWSIDASAVPSAETFHFEANARELEAIKRYAEVEDVASFKARVKIAPLSGGRFKAAGVLEARAIQASVVDLKPVPAAIEEDFAVEFWPEDSIGGAEAGPLSFEKDAPEPIAGGRLLIGEYLCELFSVSLDPYPRNPDDAFEWDRKESDAPAGPFAKLVELRRKKTDGA